MRKLHEKTRYGAKPIICVEHRLFSSARDEHAHRRWCVLAAVSGAVAPHLRAEVGLQYSTNLSQTQKFNAGVRYQPASRQVMNLSYRGTVGALRQTDFSTQWPLGRGWTALARWNEKPELPTADWPK